MASGEEGREEGGAGRGIGDQGRERGFRESQRYQGRKDEAEAHWLAPPLPSTLDEWPQLP